MASASWWSFSCEAMSKQTIWRDRGKTNLPAERLDVYSVWLLCSHAWEPCIYLDIDLYNMSWGAVPQNLGIWKVDEAMTCWLQAIQSLPPSAPKGLLGLIPGMNLGWRMLKVPSLLRSRFQYHQRSSRRKQWVFSMVFSPPLAPDFCVCNEHLLIWQ